MIAAALAPRAGESITGKGLALVEVISPVADRNRQIGAVQQYWALVRAVAMYHYHMDAAAKLDQLSQSAGQRGAAALAPRLAAAKAAVEEARLEVLASQNRLAEQVPLSFSEEGYLPSDVPVVGAYNTYFKEMSARGTFPPLTRLIDRELPLLHQALELRAAALQAAHDSLEANEQASASGKADPASVLSALDAIGAQEESFLSAVQEYNGAIAAYALNVAGDGKPREALVAMLIHPRGAAARPGTATTDLDVQRARFDSPIRSGPPAGAPTQPQPVKNEPTLAPVPDAISRDEMSADEPPANTRPRTAKKPVASSDSTSTDSTNKAKAKAKESSSSAAADASKAKDDAIFAPRRAQRPIPDEPEPKSKTSSKAPATAKDSSASKADESKDAAKKESGTVSKSSAPASGSHEAKRQVIDAPAPDDAQNGSTQSPTLQSANGAEREAPAPTAVDRNAPAATADNERAPASGVEPAQYVAPTDRYNPPPARGGQPNDSFPAASGRNPAAREPARGRETAPAATTSDALYPALKGQTPAQAAQNLSSALHWDRSLPTGQPTTPFSLEQCLALGTNRAPALAAYWNAREKAARYQVLDQALQQIESLQPVLVAARQQAGSDAMLEFRVAQLRAQADLINGERELLNAEFQLTQAAGKPTDGAWLRPSTPPHAGGYLPKLEAQPPAIAQSPAARRLVAEFPSIHSAMQTRAQAVIAADQERAERTAELQTQGGPLTDVLAAIDRETKETSTFLGLVTRYNLRIADYVLTVLPAETPQQRIVSALVLAKQ